MLNNDCISSSHVQTYLKFCIKTVRLEMKNHYLVENNENLEICKIIVWLIMIEK